MTPDLSALTVAELQKLFLKPPQRISRKLLDRLKNDPRRGVRRIGESLQREWALRRRERRRVSRMLQLERTLWRSGTRFVAGVDEAGVGPLAGPVVAAAVIFEPGVFIEGLADSKLLDAAARTRLAEVIGRKAAALGLGLAEVDEIDRLNVYWAGILAMRRAVEALPIQPERLLVDARQIDELAIPQTAVVGGDRRHFSIAAASVIAKTRRDRIMEELDRRYPGYGFGRHKGYCTPQHQKAIRRHGPSPVHRSSWSFVQELSGRSSNAFYRLKERLEQSRSREELASVRRELTAVGMQLAPAELRKIRALCVRKAKTFPQAVQLRLTGEDP